MYWEHVFQLIDLLQGIKSKYNQHNIRWKKNYR